MFSFAIVLQQLTIPRTAGDRSPHSDLGTPVG